MTLFLSLLLSLDKVEGLRLDAFPIAVALVIFTDLAALPISLVATAFSANAAPAESAKSSDSRMNPEISTFFIILTMFHFYMFGPD